MSGVTIQGRRVRIDGVRVGPDHPEQWPARGPDLSLMVALIGLVVAATIAVTVALGRRSGGS